MTKLSSALLIVNSLVIVSLIASYSALSRAYDARVIAAVKVAEDWKAVAARFEAAANSFEQTNKRNESNLSKCVSDLSENTYSQRQINRRVGH